ncbi:MAG: glutamate--tRNA ligase [Patescibacteria group bacterium]|jgi:glutamyl-tRNA synthetase
MESTPLVVRSRIAPSPTGYPHIGTIYQAWLNYSYARKTCGAFLVRIEDTDRTRFVEDAEEKLFEALDWFRISEQESPRKGGDYGPYRQSERLSIYHKYIDELLAKGYVYPCFCSQERLAEVRKEIQKKGLPPMYDKHCRNLSPEEVKERIAKGEKYVVRLKVPENETIIMNDLIRGEIKFDSNGVDDQILIKSDGFPTYHFAVVVDDHLMEITHVVRGEEWLPSSPKHILLYRMFGWDIPVFVHTPTLRNPDKSKLSKRQGHTNVVWYKEQGFLPEAVLNFLSLLGWTHPEEKEIFDRDEFIKLFDFKDLSPAGPVFNEEKLRWMNGKYIREKLGDEEIFKRVKPYLKLEVSDETLKAAIPLIKERMEVFLDVNHLLKFLEPNIEIDVAEIKKQSKKEDLEIKKLLTDLRAGLASQAEWTTPALEQMVRGLKASYEDWKGKEYFMTIRVATTAFPVTPPLFESMEILGRNLVLKRLNEVIEKL